MTPLTRWQVFRVDPNGRLDYRAHIMEATAELALIEAARPAAFEAVYEDGALFLLVPEDNHGVSRPDRGRLVVLSVERNPTFSAAGYEG